MTDPDLRPFDRYREIVPDYRACLDALHAPLPTCIWTNTLRTTPERVAERLAEEGIHAEPVPWHPGAFRLPDEASPGTKVASMS